ncbi:ABC transporter permease [Sedimentitalea sp. XS_ASV28]|uniref:ABC transporter permease n=1 Tax=Sedimentitalea sp. XS_ASV28 TaxID=3241296 RepID=UPI0035121F98
MRFHLERRARISAATAISVPLLSVLIGVALGAALLRLLGYGIGTTLHAFFIAPFASGYSISEIFLKFGPLLLIAQALAIGFRAKVWNIGAEGQMVMGAIGASAIPVYFNELDSVFVLPAMMALGAAFGMLWAGIAAFLRVRFNASEILVTLMLTAISFQILYYLVLGPWRDPMGFNFPQTVLFQDAAIFPTLFGGSRVNASIFIAVIFTVFAWQFMQKRMSGYRLIVSGMAPGAARYAGFSESTGIWVSLLLAGFAAGLAGMSEVAGPIGQLQRSITSGYGYTAIIVAYLGGLRPLGIVFAAFFLSVLHIGGDIAVVSGGIPKSAVQVLQGLLLVCYLATQLFVSHRLVAASPIARTQGAARG